MENLYRGHACSVGVRNGFCWQRFTRVVKGGGQERERRDEGQGRCSFGMRDEIEIPVDGRRRDGRDNETRMLSL